MNKITTFLNCLGGWGVIIKLVLIIFSSICAVIYANIVYAGANNKGFKMGLEWCGWFKVKWVYSFYD